MQELLIVEDDPVVARCLQAAVDADPGLRVAAVVGSCAAAEAWLAGVSTPLAAALVDLGLPDGDGVSVIRAVRGRQPQAEVMVVSVFGDEEHIVRSIEAGASGYLHKDAGPLEVAAAVHALLAGAAPMSPGVARRVLERLARRAVPPARAAEPSSPLTPRERDVLDGIAAGLSYREIAAREGVSIHTVQTHIKGLYGKLAVHSKVEAVFEAERCGWLPR